LTEGRLSDLPVSRGRPRLNLPFLQTLSFSLSYSSLSPAASVLEASDRIPTVPDKKKNKRQKKKKKKKKKTKKNKKKKKNSAVASSTSSLLRSVAIGVSLDRRYLRFLNVLRPVEGRRLFHRVMLGRVNAKINDGRAAYDFRGTGLVKVLGDEYGRRASVKFLIRSQRVHHSSPSLVNHSSAFGLEVDSGLCVTPTIGVGSGSARDRSSSASCSGAHQLRRPWPKNKEKRKEPPETLSSASEWTREVEIVVGRSHVLAEHVATVEARSSFSPGTTFDRGRRQSCRNLLDRKKKTLKRLVVLVGRIRVMCRYRRDESPLGPILQSR